MGSILSSLRLTNRQDGLENSKGNDDPEKHTGLDRPEGLEGHDGPERPKGDDGTQSPEGHGGPERPKGDDGTQSPEGHGGPNRHEHTKLNPKDAFLNSIGENKNVPWYQKTLGKMDEPARELLENYSKISSETVNSHILQVRDRAWEVAPYPCIGTFLFLDLSIARSKRYSELVTRIQGGHKLLDVGCCFAQDLRKLVHDGAPSENLWGTDIMGDFFDLGYDLFLDKNTLRSTFLAADALDPESSLNQLNGQIDIIYAGFFFHLFDWEQQVRIAERLIGILKPVPGSLILGKQSGTTIADTEIFRIKGAGGLWRHNAESFARMWNEAGERTGTNWVVHTDLIDEGASKEAWVKINTQWVTFEIERAA